MAKEIIRAGQDGVTKNDDGFSANWMYGKDYKSRGSFSVLTVTHEKKNFLASMNIGKGEDAHSIEDTNEILEPLGFEILELEEGDIDESEY